MFSPEMRMLSPNEKMVLDEDLNFVGVGNAEWDGSSRSTPDSLEDLLDDSDEESKTTSEVANNKDSVEDELDTLVNSEGSNLVNDSKSSKEEPDNKSMNKSGSSRKSIRRKR